MDMENLVPEEEEEGVLLLTDENGEETAFEYLDCIEYEGKEYLVLMHMTEEDEGEVVILEVVPVDEEMENYLAVEDEELLATIFGIFKEKFQDVLEFEN